MNNSGFKIIFGVLFVGLIASNIYQAIQLREVSAELATKQTQLKQLQEISSGSNTDLDHLLEQSRSLQKRVKELEQGLAVVSSRASIKTPLNSQTNKTAQVP